jgi:hypothetical protein
MLTYKLISSMSLERIYIPPSQIRTLHILQDYQPDHSHSTRYLEVMAGGQERGRCSVGDAGKSRRTEVGEDSLHGRLVLSQPRDEATTLRLDLPSSFTYIGYMVREMLHSIACKTLSISEKTDR